jgi:hypothetical protein
VAAPLATFGTPRYGANLARLRAHFPNAELAPARELFPSTVDWRRRWDGVLAGLAAVVFFDDGEGWVGAGVLAEVGGAAERDLPVWFLADHGRLYHLDEVEVWPVGTTAARAARIGYSVPVEEARAILVRGGEGGGGG